MQQFNLPASKSFKAINLSSSYAAAKEARVGAPGAGLIILSRKSVQIT